MFTDANPQAPDVMSINSKKIFSTLLLLCLLLVIASIIGNFLQYQYSENNTYVRRYVSFFDLNQERNLPTLYSTVLLLTASFLNFLIFVMSSVNGQKKKNRFYWFALGMIFIFLCIDESLEVHEKINSSGLLDWFSKESSFFYYVWVVPYAIVVLVTGLLFLRFVIGLPAAIRNGFFLAAFIYVTGALGLEFAESYVHVHFGSKSAWERVLWTFEETMEMTGVIIFIYALMNYISLSKTKFEVRYIIN